MKTKAVVAFVALMVATVTTAHADFRIGTEGGLYVKSLEHSFKFAGGSGQGVDCGSEGLDPIKDAIGNPVGFYGHWTKASDGHGWGVRGGYYTAGDAKVTDLLLTSRGTANGNDGFIGIGWSKMTVAVSDRVSFGGLCNSATRGTVTFPAGELELSGVKFIFSVERWLTNDLYWTTSGTWTSYTDVVNTGDGFETTLGASVWSVAVGLIYEL